MNEQIDLSIIAARDGGVVIYEAKDGDSVLVFGGDPQAATKYLAGRMEGLQGQSPPAEPIPHYGSGTQTGQALGQARFDHLNRPHLVDRLPVNPDGSAA